MERSSDCQVAGSKQKNKINNPHREIDGDYFFKIYFSGTIKTSKIAAT